MSSNSTIPVEQIQELGQAIEEVRVERGLSFESVAKLSDGAISASGLHRIVRGERLPTLESLIALSKPLKVSFVIAADGITVRPTRRRSI